MPLSIFLGDGHEFHYYEGTIGKDGKEHSPFDGYKGFMMERFEPEKLPLAIRYIAMQEARGLLRLAAEHKREVEKKIESVKSAASSANYYDKVARQWRMKEFESLEPGKTSD